MKHTCLSLGIVLGVFIACTTASAESVYVQVRRSTIKKEPKAFAAVVSSVREGDELSVVSDEGNWLSVTTKSGKSGFIAKKSVSEDKVELASASSGKLGVDVDESDTVAAAKGFDKDTEKDYRMNQQSADFDAVDRLERRAIPGAEVAKFVKSGKLNSEG